MTTPAPVARMHTSGAKDETERPVASVSIRTVTPARSAWRSVVLDELEKDLTAAEFARGRVRLAAEARALRSQSSTSCPRRAAV